MSFIDTPPFLSEPENEPLDFQVAECPICTEVKRLHFASTCRHAFCENCLISYIEIKVMEADVRHLGCPSCNRELFETDIYMFMNDEIRQKYQHFKEVKRVEENLYVKWCPQPDCRGYDVASPDNYKLCCNICGHKYCYKCSKPWHNKGCKIKKDVTFELWAMANNVKICPRCKNHVQKNGGCPHMYCPRCQHRWCWICGGDYSSPNHNTFTCMLGRSPLDLYGGIILLLLLFPVLIPFGIFLMTVYFYETEAVEKERLRGPLACFKSRIVAYSLAFIFSPVLEAIGVVVAYFAITYGIASKNYYNASKTDILFRLIVGNMLCNLLFVGLMVVLALLIVLLPAAGVFFTITKIYFIMTRCCKPKPEFEYPRLFS